MKKTDKGKFIVIVGPSASGKTEIVKALISKIPNSARLITTTTRVRRPGEKDDYFFVSRKEFEKGIKEGDFFEYAEVYGNLYGPSKKVLEEYRRKFKYVFAIIDVQGAQTLKSKIKDATIIFIRPGSLGDVRRRLLAARGELPGDELKRRMDTAAHELSLAKKFDAVVDNLDDRFDEAVENVLKIVLDL